MITPKLDKDINFLMILYQISKNQNSFPDLREDLVNYHISEEDRKHIKDILRSDEKVEKIILRYGKLKEIYEKNKRF